MMIKKAELIFINLFLVFVFSGNIFQSGNSVAEENHPPVVKILEPKNNSVFEPTTPVSYKISVSDEEDGESKYDEIAANEVLLQVKYIADATKISAALNNTESEPPGLTAMRTSNCFNCHGFDTKSIGPSFYEINKRYTSSKENTYLLIKRIKEGSSGVWGDVTMPTHPELTNEETHNMVLWILKNGADTNINYYLGTEGSFHIKPPAASTVKATYILTASYTDHGTEDNPKQKLRGQDVVIIQSK